MFKSIDKIENHINNARFDKALDALDYLYEKLEQTKNDALEKIVPSIAIFEKQILDFEKKLKSLKSREHIPKGLVELEKLKTEASIVIALTEHVLKK